MSRATEGARPGPASGGPAEIRVLSAAAVELHQPVDGVQAFEGVLTVEKPAFVLLPEVPFDIGPGERGTAEDDGVALEAPLVELEQVVAHYERRFDQEAGHPDDVGAHFLGRAHHVGYGHLGAEVVHFIAVVGEDYVDQVLADVVDVALDCRQHYLAFAALVGLGHVRFQEADGRFHDLGRLQDERELHAARAEQFADRLHACHQWAVHYLQGGRPSLEHFGEVGFQAVFPAVHHALFQPPLHRPPAAVLLGQPFRSGAVEKSQQLGQRVVVAGRVAPVVNEVQADLDGLGG